MVGGCADCHSTVEVRLATPEELDAIASCYGGSSAYDLLREFGDTFRYVCSEHSFYGRRCPGSGNTPMGITAETEEGIDAKLLAQSC